MAHQPHETLESLFGAHQRQHGTTQWNDLSTMPLHTEQVRSRLFLLNSSSAFLNHGSYGSLPAPVASFQRFVEERMEAHSDVFMRRDDCLWQTEALAAWAGLVRAPLRNFVFVPNVTTALCAALNSQTFGPGDVLLAPDLAYQACKNAMRATAERTGAEYREFSMPLTSSADVVKSFQAALDDESMKARVKFALIDIVTSPTAALLNWQEMCNLCKACGVISFVDGAHAVGQVPLSLHDCPADYLASNMHKWSFAPKGTCFLFVADSMKDRTNPLVTSWNFRSPDIFQRFFMQGTRDNVHYIASFASFKLFEALCVDRVVTCNTSFADWAECYLKDLWSTDSLLPPELQSPYLRVIEMPLAIPEYLFVDFTCDAVSNLGNNLLMHMLLKYDVVVAVLVYKKKLYVRVSSQIYVTREDVIRLGFAVKEIAAHAQELWKQIL